MTISTYCNSWSSSLKRKPGKVKVKCPTIWWCYPLAWLLLIIKKKVSVSNMAILTLLRRWDYWNSLTIPSKDHCLYRTVLPLLQKEKKLPDFTSTKKELTFAFICLKTVLLQKDKPIFFQIPNKFYGRLWKGISSAEQITESCGVLKHSWNRPPHLDTWFQSLGKGTLHSLGFSYCDQSGNHFKDVNSDERDATHTTLLHFCTQVHSSQWIRKANANWALLETDWLSSTF